MTRGEELGQLAPPDDAPVRASRPAIGTRAGKVL